jgi:Fe-S cluster assembly protein SufD
MDENSNVQYYKIQNEETNAYHVGTTQIFQERSSIFTSVTLSWGGSVIRNNLNSYLNGEGIECNYKGLYFLTGKQHVDNHTLADHANPNCHSNELYKGILADESDGVFNGKIMVRQDAQKTNAYQMNKNILLSNKASVNSKPQLEIYADDVKCSHGATTGQIDKEQLFYLKARGIGEKEGKKLLIFAFANEIIEDIDIPELKDYLVNKLNEKLENL